MPVILVVIIVVAWIVILGPNLMKRRSQAAGGGNFRLPFPPVPAGPRALRSRADRDPGFPARAVGRGPGNRRARPYPEVSAMPVLTVVGADQLPRPALAFLGDDPPPRAPAVTRPTGRRRRPVRRIRSRPRPLRSMDDRSPVRRTPTSSRPRSRSRCRRPCLEGDSRQLGRQRRRATLGILASVFVGTLYDRIRARCRRRMDRVHPLRRWSWPPTWRCWSDCAGRRGTRAQAPLPEPGVASDGHPGRGDPDPRVHERTLRPSLQPGGRRPLRAAATAAGPSRPAGLRGRLGCALPGPALAGTLSPSVRMRHDLYRCPRIHGEAPLSDASGPALEGRVTPHPPLLPAVAGRTPDARTSWPSTPSTTGRSRRRSRPCCPPPSSSCGTTGRSRPRPW